jgi:hypothetical protein
MAGRGQVSWLPGWSAAPSRGLCVVPSGWRYCACGFLDPVTVAGPHRTCTGLPLTTDRIYTAESIPLWGHTIWPYSKRPRPHHWISVYCYGTPE